MRTEEEIKLRINVLQELIKNCDNKMAIHIFESRIELLEWVLESEWALEN